MNAESNTPMTLQLMGQWDHDRRNDARERFQRAGLKPRDAATLERAERIASSLFALVTLLQRDARMGEIEGGDGSEPPPMGLCGYLRGGVEEATDILAHDLCASLESIGKESEA